MAQFELGTAGTPLISGVIRTDVIRYWGSLNNEISYPIDCKMLARVLAQSPTGHVALRIENITTPANVLAYWIPFDNSNYPTDTAFYRILDRDLVNSLCADVAAAFNNKKIDARIAQPSSGDYYVFFNKANITRKGPGGAGGIDPAGVTVR